MDSIAPLVLNTNVGPVTSMSSIAGWTTLYVNSYDGGTKYRKLFGYKRSGYYKPTKGYSLVVRISGYGMLVVEDQSPGKRFTFGPGKIVIRDEGSYTIYVVQPVFGGVQYPNNGSPVNGGSIFASVGLGSGLSPASAVTEIRVPEAVVTVREERNNSDQDDIFTAEMDVPVLTSIYYGSDGTTNHYIRFGCRPEDADMLFDELPADVVTRATYASASIRAVTGPLSGSATFVPSDWGTIMVAHSLTAMDGVIYPFGQVDATHRPPALISYHVAGDVDDSAATHNNLLIEVANGAGSADDMAVEVFTVVHMNIPTNIDTLVDIWRAYAQT